MQTHNWFIFVAVEAFGTIINYVIKPTKSLTLLHMADILALPIQPEKKKKNQHPE